ncbi:MAG: EamA family transporter [candidate division Zixibacteria bacterium]|nr:EamA family transporter [candidate division Zixibacteria bacterium]
MALIALTAVTLIGFAANSLLCRIALSGDLIDPVSFTTLRLVSGALVLYPLSLLTREPKPQRTSQQTLVSAFALFAYAIAFSLAYVSLSTGVGALILFGAVQVTMIAAALRSGERLRTTQWIGAVVAFGGLIYLVSPGITSPNPSGALLMAVSGIAWGIYSVRGRNAAAPVAITAGNFIWAAPLAILISVVSLSNVHWELTGVVLAIVSGAIASGVVYVLWYRTLRELTTTHASIVQLLVPVLAAFGGVMVLAEPVTIRLIAAGIIVLGGIVLAGKPLKRFSG